MSRRRIFSVLWALVLAGTALAPAPALADHDDDDFSVLLGPDRIRETDGGFEVSFGLAGSTVSLTFAVDEDEDVQVRSVRGLPDGATADVDGEDVEITFPDGEDEDVDIRRSGEHVRYEGDSDDEDEGDEDD